MAYRNGTYVAFHAQGTNLPGKSDMDYYNLMKAWSAKTDDDFTMINSHDKAASVRDTSKKATLRASLLDRLRNSKNMVLIIGKTTRLDTDWVPFEISSAVDTYSLPIIAVYQVVEIHPYIPSILIVSRDDNHTKELPMRGADISQNALFVTVTVEDFVPLDHPLRALRDLINEALKDLDGLFGSIYADAGRESIPPERLVRALLLQVLYTIRSERQLMEQVRYNMLYRGCVGLTMDDDVWSHSTFSKNRDRLLAHDVVGELFETVVEMARARGLLSEEHFSVDGTLIQAWASQKSFRPKDEGPGGTGRNDERDFHGEERKNDTHHSVTDPDARLYRKSQGTGAVLCYQGHSVMENRHGLVVKAKVSHASGTAERDTALELLRTLPGNRRKTVGGDKGYDVKSFIQGCREQRITAHVAAKSKGSAIDQRTQRHAGYAVSQKIRKRIEETFGWNKSIGTLRQVKQRGLARVDALFQFGMLSWNLTRMRNILAVNTPSG